MSRLFPGLAVGGLTGFSIVLAEVAITGSSSVGLQEAVGVGVAACGMVLLVDRKFQAHRRELLQIRSILHRHSRLLAQLTGTPVDDEDKENEQ